MKRLPTINCAACDAPVRRAGSWASCPACTSVVKAHLRRTVGLGDPGAWIVALNQVFGSRERFVSAVREG